MTFGDFVSVLSKSGFFQGTQPQIGQRLFKSAGPKCEVSEDAIKTWIQGTKNPRTSVYFPDDELNESQQIQLRRFFSSRTPAPGDWRNLQESFGEWKKSNQKTERFCVDVSTDNKEIFYRSLTNQFCMIFHLPILEQEEYAVSPHEASSKEVWASFINAVQDYGVMELINKERPIYNREDADVLDAFVYQMRNHLACNYPRLDLSLQSLITSFVDKLDLQIMSMYATFSAHPGLDTEPEFVNMEDDVEGTFDRPNMENRDLSEECFEEDNVNDENMDGDGLVWDSITNFFLKLGHKIEANLKAELIDLEDVKDFIIEFAEELSKMDEDDDIEVNMPIRELEWNLNANSANPAAVYKLSLENWESFRKEMNIWYDKICSWKESSPNM